MYLSTTSAFDNWYAIDTSSSNDPLAKFGGKSPVDRAKRGIKKIIVVDSKGVPIVVSVGPANTHDSKTLVEILSLLESIKNVPYAIVAVDSVYDAKSLKKWSKRHGFILFAS